MYPQHLQATLKRASIKDCVREMKPAMLQIPVWSSKTYFLILIFTPFLQGLYVFAVYFIIHNQLCWPTKASYTVEMSGHDSTDSAFHGGGPTTVGGDISKSTQNLITAMEEVNTKTLKSSTHYWRKNC